MIDYVWLLINYGSYPKLSIPLFITFYVTVFDETKPLHNLSILAILRFTITDLLLKSIIKHAEKPRLAIWEGDDLGLQKQIHELRRRLLSGQVKAAGLLCFPGNRIGDGSRAILPELDSNPHDQWIGGKIYRKP